MENPHRELCLFIRSWVSGDISATTCHIAANHVSSNHVSALKSAGWRLLMRNGIVITSWGAIKNAKPLFVFRAYIWWRSWCSFSSYIFYSTTLCQICLNKLNSDCVFLKQISYLRHSISSQKIIQFLKRLFTTPSKLVLIELAREIIGSYLLLNGTVCG